MPGSDSKQNQSNEQIEWVARASRVLVSASRRNNLFNIRRAIADVEPRETEFQERRRSQTGVWEREGSAWLRAGAIKPPKVCVSR